MAQLIPFNYRRSDLSPHSLFNMMDDFFNDAWPVSRTLMHDTFKVDVQESDSAYTIEAEMPGIQKEEINLSLNDDRLTISVERKENTEENKENYVHRERRYSSMQRSIYLADAFDEGINASLSDGVLKVVIQKRAKAEISKKIEIN
jgi:HSP20 family protein